MTQIIEINSLVDRVSYNQHLKDFEGLFSYPFGDNRFRIDHGNDYFSFFESLGKPYCFAAKENGKIVALCIAVLRKLPVNGNPSKNVWYLCDLKIHPNYRGQFIVYKILNYAFPQHSKLSNKIYGISMNSKNDQTNRIVRFISRLPHLNLKHKCNIKFYLLKTTDSNFSKRFINKHKSNFISLSGKKDLILESTKQALPIMHYSKRKFGSSIIEGKQNSNYMFCYEEGHSNCINFSSNNIISVASASVVANFTSNSWDFIESGEI